MDPNEVLRTIRKQVAMLTGKGPELLTPERYEEWALNMAGEFDSLDQWLSAGGFPPEEWREGPDAVGAVPDCNTPGPDCEVHDGACD